MTRAGWKVSVSFAAMFALVGCKSTAQRLHDVLVDGFATEESWASALCGYEAQGLTTVQVTAVQNSGASNMGSGTATVTGTPIPYPGSTPPPGPCTGSIAFTYGTVTTGRTTTYVRGRRRVNTQTALQINGITVTNRTSPAMVPPSPTAANPTPGMAAPAGAAAGSCAAYQTCCTALAAMPAMSAMAASCAQVSQLSAMGAQGESICAQTLSGLRQGLAAMPNAPASCR